jgi:hypothetical protein
MSEKQMVEFYIPTFGRPETQHTYAALHAAGLDPVLVVDSNEKALYQGYVHTRANVRGLAEKRAWIATNATADMHAQFDDDLVFSMLVIPPGKDLRGMLSTSAGIWGLRHMERLIAALLQHYPHGAVSPRHNWNGKLRDGWPYAVNTRQTRSALFFNRALWKQGPATKDIPWDSAAEDLAWQLSLLKQKLPYAIITDVCFSEKKPPNHDVSGVWSYSNAGSRERNATAVKKQYGAVVRKDGSVDWRATCRLFGVPEYLNGEPCVRKIRLQDQ